MFRTHLDEIGNTLTPFNSLHPDLNLTMEVETNSTLNYLHLTITNTHGQLEYQIYRKPTATDVDLINQNSCCMLRSCHPPYMKGPGDERPFLYFFLFSMSSSD
jgi:hypothetical protein